MTGPPVSDTTVQVTGATSGIVRNRQPRMGQRPPGVMLNTPAEFEGTWTFRVVTQIQPGGGDGNWMGLSVGLYTRDQWAAAVAAVQPGSATSAFQPSDQNHAFRSQDYYVPGWSPPEPASNSGQLVTDQRWLQGNAAPSGTGGSDFEYFLGAVDGGFVGGPGGTLFWDSDTGIHLPTGPLDVQWDFPVFGIIGAGMSGVFEPGDRDLGPLPFSLPPDPMLTRPLVVLTNGVRFKTYIMSPPVIVGQDLFKSAGMLFGVDTSVNPPRVFQEDYVAITSRAFASSVDLSLPPESPKSIETGAVLAGLTEF